MAFVCVGCSNRFPEKKRTFERTDWCPKCILAENKRTSRGTDANGVPNLRAELPKYVTQPTRP